MRLVVLSVLVGSTWACGGSTTGGDTSTCTAATATATTSVSLTGYAFSPACVKVTAGTSVTFTNLDPTTHTVTSDTGEAETYDSGNLLQSGTFTHAFAAAGTRKAHCAIHTAMHLTVVVQ